ncbi:MAG: archaeal heat shock protein Hsp20 [Dehalococcoidia bacterium]
MEHRRIRELRGHLDLSQERFARLLGVSLQTVRRWESGLTKPLPIISLKLEELQREIRSPKNRVGGIPMGGARKQGGAGIELGLGGLFKGVGSLLDLVSKMAEHGTEETTGSGEVEGLGGKLRGVYGFSVRTGLGGTPVIEQFGNIQETETGPVVAETREPLVDVLDEGDHLTVIVELPGVEEGDIKMKVEGDILEVSASSGGRKYHKEVLLPSAVEPGSLKSSHRNGVLEISLAKQQP